MEAFGMQKGLWKKYEKTEIKAWNERASYDELYDDLKDSGKDWEIASDYRRCKEQLCDGFVSDDVTEAGDIYVYYVDDNGNKTPKFYVKVMEYWNASVKKNFILFNGCSLGFDGIDNKYLPELMTKLCEIDEIKNKGYIDELDIRYKNYRRLLSLKEKDEYTDEELLFLYYMAYVKNDNMAISMIKDRDIQNDFDSFSDENKVNLFLHIKNSPISNELSIDSKDILMTLAQNRCLKQLNNASEEIISDKAYIMSLLECFFSANSISGNFEIRQYLPSRYQADIDVLELIISECLFTSFDFNYFVNLNSDLKQKITEPQFAYRLVDSFIRSLIVSGGAYYESGWMYFFPNEILYDIENHILIGPEPTEQRENLKNESVRVLKREKEQVAVYRLKHGNKE